MKPVSKIIIQSVTAAFLVAAVTFSIMTYQALNQGYDLLLVNHEPKTLTETREIPSDIIYVQAEQVIYQLLSIYERDYDIRVNDTTYSHTDPSTFSVEQVQSHSRYRMVIHRDHEGKIQLVQYQGV